MSDEKKNEILEKIAEIAMCYMMENRDDFIKHWDILPDALVNGIKSCIRLWENKKELIKDAKSDDEKVKIYNKAMHEYLKEFKKTLPDFAILLRDEIENAFEAGVDAAMCAIAHNIDGCKDCPSKADCKHVKSE